MASQADRESVYRYFNSPREGYLFDVTARAFFDSVNLFRK